MEASQPILPPPLGLDIYESKQRNAYAATFVTWILALAAVGLRFLARRISKASYWWDDWLMVLALVISTVSSFLSYVFMLRHGVGMHIWAFKPTSDDFVDIFKGLFILQVCYVVELTLVKCSILSFYWRIFKVSSIRYPIYILYTIVIVWGVSTLITICLQCIPINGFWDKSIHASCKINTHKFFEGYIIPNIIVDVFLLALPVPYIWRLKISQSSKAFLCGLFLLGGFVVAVSIVRMIFFLKSQSSNRSELDIFWTLADLDIWSVVEQNIALVSGCLPSMGSFFRSIYSSSFWQSLHNHYSNSRARLLAQRLSGYVTRREYSKQQSSGSQSNINASTQNTAHGPGRSFYIARPSQESSGDRNGQELFYLTKKTSGSDTPIV